MKILYITTIGITMGFFEKHFEMLIKQGHTIELAANCDESPVAQFCVDMGLKTHNIPFSRSPLSTSNLKAYKQIKLLIKNGGYDVVHTHTPNASLFSRLACIRLRKNGLKVIYTAHGFHFYKGAPLLNWLIYYPIEWFCAHFTDVLITINKEDYEFAKKHMHAKKIEYVPGVGVDLEKFGCSDTDPIKKRAEIGVPDDKVWMLSVGELSVRKNHETLIRALAEIPSVYLTIAGRGPLQEHLVELVEQLKLTDRVLLLGYRSDISQLCSAADIFCLPSYQEGLPVALMEAMSCGKPCVVSRIRGNTDLIRDLKATFDPHSVNEAKNTIEWMLKSDFNEIGEINSKVIQNFGVDEVVLKMKEIYDTKV